MKQNKLLYNIKKIASEEEKFEPVPARGGAGLDQRTMNLFHFYNKYAPNFLQNKTKTKAYQLGQTFRSDIWRMAERARNLEKYKKQGVPEDLLLSRLQTSIAADGLTNKNPKDMSWPDKVRDNAYYLAAFAHDKDFQQGQMDQDRLIAHNKARRDNIAYQNSWMGKLKNTSKSLFNRLRNLGK